MSSVLTEQEKKEIKEYDLWNLERALNFAGIEDVPKACEYFLSWIDDLVKKHKQSGDNLRDIQWALLSLIVDSQKRTEDIYGMMKPLKEDKEDV